MVWTGYLGSGYRLQARGILAKVQQEKTWRYILPHWHQELQHKKALRSQATVPLNWNKILTMITAILIQMPSVVWTDGSMFRAVRLVGRIQGVCGLGWGKRPHLCFN